MCHRLVSIFVYASSRVCHIAPNMKFDIIFISKPKTNKNEFTKTAIWVFVIMEHFLKDLKRKIYRNGLPSSQVLNGSLSLFFNISPRAVSEPSFFPEVEWSHAPGCSDWWNDLHMDKWGLMKLINILLKRLFVPGFQPEICWQPSCNHEDVKNKEEKSQGIYCANLVQALTQASLPSVLQLCEAVNFSFYLLASFSICTGKTSTVWFFCPLHGLNIKMYLRNLQAGKNPFFFFLN